MPRYTASRARRTLVWLGVLVLAAVAGLAAAVQYSTASWAPRLALDLAGGTEIVLTPQLDPGEGQITDQVIADSIAIIRQRVNSTGVSEAEVTSEGGQNIVVSLPGDPAEQAQARALVAQAAQMRFRPVLVAAPAVPAVPAAPAAPAAPADPGAATGSESVVPAPGTLPAEPLPAEPTAPAPTPTTNGSVVPRALLAAQPSTPPAPADSAAPVPVDPALPPTTNDGPSALEQITPEIAAAFEALDCSDPVAVGTALNDDPKAPVVTCDAAGTAKYILGPVEIEGTDIDGAVAGRGSTQTGAPTGEWVVNLNLDAAAGEVFAGSTARLSLLAPPRNQFAIVLDGTVISAPSVNQVISGGQAEISGSFTQASATALANQVQFGALPISFTKQTENQISATLGAEQLQRGLLAGAIGLALVALYSLFQYRLLGLVTIGSLVVAGTLSYLAITLLSWGQGFRLSLAGVAGLIVAIGITADSFIVFFERVRDEVREGRPLVPAVETGWVRARRTILISGLINILAAVVLYVLAVGSVRGFAFTLGLTTVIDLVVVVLFTHPVVVLLARAPFFAGGHRLSGFDAEHLGRTVAYAGRGRVRSAAGQGETAEGAPVLVGAGVGGGRGAEERRLTIAERKALSAGGATSPVPLTDGPPTGALPAASAAPDAAPPRGRSGSVRGSGRSGR